MNPDFSNKNFWKIEMVSAEIFVIDEGLTHYGKQTLTVTNIDTGEITVYMVLSTSDE